MRTPVELRFEKGDPVRDYWLARGEGFAVENRRGRVVGEVVDVVVDPERQRVMSLIVQRSRGITELPVEQIQAVVPARDAFILDGAQSTTREKKRSRPRRRRLARFRARAVPALRQADAFALASGRAGVAWVAAVARLLARELQRPPR
jgi:sporulation protein YlmC with PRC-barrel domain